VEHNRRLPYSAGQIESELGIGPAAAGRGVLVSDRFGSAALDGCFWPVSAGQGQLRSDTRCQIKFGLRQITSAPRAWV